jgi:hypothetical protein
MDPYLEADLWQEFHQTLATSIRASLLGELPRHYVALLSKYYVVQPTIDVPQLRVEIRDVAQRRLVTVIALLSRANKIGQGWHEYQDKRKDLLQSDVHLIEIDLLREGEPLTFGPSHPEFQYYISLTRAQVEGSRTIWPLRLPERLPAIPVPLLEPDPDVVLDLQAAFTASFDLVGYERLIDYDAPPPAPAFSPAGMQWIDALLKVRGVRG